MCQNNVGIHGMMPYTLGPYAVRPTQWGPIVWVAGASLLKKLQLQLLLFTIPAGVVSAATAPATAAVAPIARWELWQLLSVDSHFGPGARAEVAPDVVSGSKGVSILAT